MQTQDENGGKSSEGRDTKPCPPENNAVIYPPGEVSLVLAGAAIGLSIGFALGAMFAVRIGQR